MMKRGARPSGVYEMQFCLKAELEFGEQPFVTGSCASLGSVSQWDEESFEGQPYAVLHTTPETYPEWVSSMIPVPQNDVVVYRYGVLRAGEFLRWETVASRSFETALSHTAGSSVLVTQDALDHDSHGEKVLPVSVSLTMPTGEKKPTSKTMSVAFDSMDILGPATPQSNHTRRGSVGFSSSWNSSRLGDSARDEAASISSQDGVVVVSLFLPVLVTRLEGGEAPHFKSKWKVEWDYENLLSLQAAQGQMRVTRVGVVRFAGSISPEEETSLAEALKPFNCVPVFLEKTLARKFYRDFCKGFLWPVFHHVVDVYGNVVTKVIPVLEDLWQCYTQVNRMFKEKIVEVYNVGDLIWVHGFQLLLLPSFLSRTLRVARIGLFLHTPFPSSEIFRTLPFREDLLRSMLSADQIGFHLFEYARHFVTCCRRILGLYQVDVTDGASRGPTMNMKYQGRLVQIVSIHAGIEGNVIETALSPERNLQKDVKELREKYASGNRFVFLGIDKVESLKGLHLKLHAWALLLEGDPGLIERACMVQVGISAHEMEQDYQRTEGELQALSSQINEKYGKPGLPAIIYLSMEESALGLEARLPFLLLGDCLVNTVGRDGLNRLPLEFVLAHAVSGSPKPGVMILSEFTSCMRVLRGALRVNPWKIPDVAHCMLLALNMTPEQRVDRHTKDEGFALHHSTLFWSTEILSSLKRVPKSDTRHGMSSMGLGLNYRAVGMESAFIPLDSNAVTRAYRTSKQRVIFLDYGGTIVEDTKSKYGGDAIRSPGGGGQGDDSSGLSPALRLALTHLCSDPRNLVFLVTGRAKESLVGDFESIKGLGLAAEHGLFYRWPREQSWETLVALHDQSWQVLTKTIMEIYVMRTHGTYIEEKGSTILWKFEDADPDFGFLQSRELEDHLTSVLVPFSVEVLRGGGGEGAGGYLEVRPMGVNKGAFVETVLDKLMGSLGPPDFVFAVGDDASDETMFTTVRNYEEHTLERVKDTSKFGAADSSSDLPSSVKCYTCTVGKKPTEAMAYLHDTIEVAELLSALSRVSAGMNRNYSTSFLSEMASPAGMATPTGFMAPFTVSPTNAGGGDIPINDFNFQGAASGHHKGSASDSLIAIGRSMSVGIMPMHHTEYSQAPLAAATTMSQYFSHIEEENEDEDEEGLFF